MLPKFALPGYEVRGEGIATLRRDIHRAQRVAPGHVAAHLKTLPEYQRIAIKEHGWYLLFSYTDAANSGGKAGWTLLEQTCRGVVTDNGGTVLALPFAKFFNWVELTPHEQDQLVNGVGLDDVTLKEDGCFLANTRLNLWGGGTVRIGDVVNKKLTPTLIGMDDQGRLVPSQVTAHHNNGRKDRWLAITIDAPVSRLSGAAGRPNVLRVTPNHHVFVNGAFRPAGEITPGDRMVTSRIAPGPRVLSAIESGLLGDGSISKNGNGWRYQEGHRDDHQGYVDEVNRWLGPCAVKQSSTQSGYGTTMTWAQSKSYAGLGALRDKWYPHGVKVVPDDLSWLDDFAVARWYMDDGCLSHNTVQQDRALLATNAFTEDDVRRLARALTERYGVACAVAYKKGWAIRINAGRDGSIESFWAAIAPHVVPVMRYKLPERYRDVPYMCYPDGQEEIFPVDAIVTAVESIPVDPSGNNEGAPFQHGRCGYDITTTVGNYFAGGVLVHNSLGIVWRDGHQWRCTTRGAFDSVQAVWATSILNRYRLEEINGDYTLMVEIIHPRNRIVVDYGDRAELVLLGVRDRTSGLDLTREAVHLVSKLIGMRDVETIHAFAPAPDGAWRDDVPDIENILAHAADAKGIEGWVLRFRDNTRVKVKTSEYVELHRLVTGLTPTRVRDSLLAGTWHDDRLKLPEELLAIADGYADVIFAATQKMAQDVMQYESTLRIVDTGDREGRKWFAIGVKIAVPEALRGMVFKWHDGKLITNDLLRAVDLATLFPAQQRAGWQSWQERGV